MVTRTYSLQGFVTSLLLLLNPPIIYDSKLTYTVPRSALVHLLSSYRPQPRRPIGA